MGYRRAVDTLSPSLPGRLGWVCCVLPPGDEPGNAVRLGWLGAGSTGQGTREPLDLHGGFSPTLQVQGPSPWVLIQMSGHLPWAGYLCADCAQGKRRSTEPGTV